MAKHVMVQLVCLFVFASSVWAVPEPPHLYFNIEGLTIHTTWTEVPGATGYTLHYAPVPYAGPQSIGSVPMGGDTALSVTLWEGAAYYLAVTAQDETGSSGFSNIEQFVIGSQTIPYPPVLSPTINNQHVYLSWNAVPGATGYALHYAPLESSGAESYERIDLGNRNSFSIDLWDGAKYKVAVTAYSSAGESDFSNLAPLVIDTTPPVVSIDDFTDWPYWQLDITWHAQDTYGDGDTTGSAEMTASARYIIPQTDKGDLYGIWATNSQDNGVRSWNVTYTGYTMDTDGSDRLDFAYTDNPHIWPPIKESAIGGTLIIDGNSLQYKLVVTFGFPLRVTGGFLDESGQALTIATPEMPFFIGTLPSGSSQVISGSGVIPLELAGPGFFGDNHLTNVGFQFALRPLPLAPLGRQF